MKLKKALRSINFQQDTNYYTFIIISIFSNQNLLKQ